MEPRLARDIHVMRFSDTPAADSAVREFREWREEHLDATVFQIDVHDEDGWAQVYVWYSE